MTSISVENLVKNYIEENGASTLIQFGIEKEGLRCDTEGRLSSLDHPTELGSKLTHPTITTDYGESLLEYITPVYTNIEKGLEFLAQLQHYTFLKMESNELIWPASIPCKLPEDSKIKCADYGPSHVGKLKNLYRIGLGHRYGRSMQSIAGIHYNFSFSDDFIEYLRIQTVSAKSFKDFRSAFYFSLIRNFRRNNWLLLYLFGSSPVVDESFLVGKKHKLHNFGSGNYGLPYATSLRMGEVGYTSNAQKSLNICFNNLKTYITSLEKARLTPYPLYEKIGVKVDGEYRQLNTHLLQIDNEYYSVVRPKYPAQSKESALQALHRNGVSYVEVRLLDLNPANFTGLSAKDIAFLHSFMLFCAIQDETEISDIECGEIASNFSKVVSNGRDASLKLVRRGEQVFLRDWGAQIIEKTQELSMFLVGEDKKLIQLYQDAINEQRLKLADDSLTPAGQMMQVVAQGKNFIQHVLELAKLHKRQVLQKKLPPHIIDQLRSMADQSWKDVKDIENKQTGDFDEFLEGYFADIKINCDEVKPC